MSLILQVTNKIALILKWPKLYKSRVRYPDGTSSASG